MKLQEKEISAYEAEHQNIPERLMREMPPFKEAERFLELVQDHFPLTVRRVQHPKVIVLGSGFPEELIHACRITQLGDWEAVCKPPRGPVNWHQGMPTR